MTLKKSNRQFKKKRFLVSAISNVILSVLLLCVGILSFAPTSNVVETDTEGVELYRFGNANSGGVSLMFNVYWGTEETYQILHILKTVL